MKVTKLMISTVLAMLVLFWIVSPSASVSAAAVESAHEGVLDLSAWDFEEDGSVPLDGDWEFYWNRLLTPPVFLQSDHSYPTGWIHLPHSWNGSATDAGKLSGNGYATFRLTLQLQGNHPKLALGLPTMFSAYKLWINGEWLASVGQVGTDRDHTTPRLATRIVQFQPLDGNNELVIQVANFHHLRGGMTKSILLGTEQQIGLHADKRQAFEMFVVGTLLFMGIYHVALFIMRTKDRAPLYFGLFSIIWGMRGLLVGQVVWTKFFPHFPWEWQMKLEYLALYGGTFLFVIYLRHLFLGAMPAWFYRGSQLFLVIAVIPVIVTPARVYTRLLALNETIIVMQLLFLLYIVVRAFKERREGALVLSWIGAFTLLTCINDFLFFAEKWPYFGSLSPFGLFVFTFGQVFILSRRFTDAFRMAESYSVQVQNVNSELQELNESLERKVQERSQELREVNDSLQESYYRIRHAEQSRKTILSYITHDLRNSVTVIVGYSEALTDQIRSDLHPKFIRYIHTGAVRIDRMIDDLYYLSQLESGQIPFQMQESGIGELADRVYAGHQERITDAGLLFTVECPEHLSKVTVNVDPDQIERVFNNLIGNAIKFTSAGGTIALRFRIVPQEAVKGTELTVKEVGAAMESGYRKLDINRIEGRSMQEVLVEIADTGKGISRQDLPNIFERHYKGMGNSEAGSGLGLAICKEIVERHEGRIWAESTMQQGSRFYFCLPMCRNDDSRH